MGRYPHPAGRSIPPSGWQGIPQPGRAPRSLDLHKYGYELNLDLKKSGNELSLHLHKPGNESSLDLHINKSPKWNSSLIDILSIWFIIF